MPVVVATVTVAEAVGVAVLPGVLVIGVAGIAAVVAIGSALIALGSRRTRDEELVDDEEVPEPVRP